MLHGSVTQIRVWLLLEYTGLWRAKAVDDNDLPEPVKEWLTATLGGTELARLLFIKQPLRKVDRSALFYVAVTDEMAPRLYRFRLDAYEDLLKLDVAAIVAGDPAYEAHLDEDSLYLVCTNGNRDACCARRGVPAYRRMAEIVGERVWQCSHMGGHRFSANCLHMPVGITYGHVDHDTPAFVEACDRGQVCLAHYRGRSHYEKPAQVGEYFLRQQTGVTKLAHYRLTGVESRAEKQWMVHFEGPMGEAHAVYVEEVPSGWQAIQSCGDAEEGHVPQYVAALHEP